MRMNELPLLIGMSNLLDKLMTALAQQNASFQAYPVFIEHRQDCIHAMRLKMLMGTDPPDWQLEQGLTCMSGQGESAQLVVCQSTAHACPARSAAAERLVGLKTPSQEACKGILKSLKHTELRNCMSFQGSAASEWRVQMRLTRRGFGIRSSRP